MSDGADRRLGRLGRVADALTERVVQSVPPDVLLEHVDLDAVLDQVDVNHLLDRVDVNRLLDRVDVDRLLDRVDVDRLMSGVDLEALVRRAGVPEIVSETTGSLAGGALDTARRQLVSVDTLFGHFTDRVLRRGRASEEGPPALLAAVAEGRRGVVSGRYAGGVARALAFTVDLVVALATYGGVTAWATWMWQRLTAAEVPDVDGAWATAALFGWIGGYLVLTTTIAGSTIGKALVGLRVVRRDGSAVPPTSALVRVLALPLSTALFGLGLLWSLFDRRRRALHDLLARTVVVYDWGDRPAEISGPLTEFLRRRDDM